MRTNAFALSTGLALALVWAGCETPKPSVQPPATPEETLSAHMEEHLDRVTETRDAVIAGDLEAAKESATWLSEHEPAAQIQEAWIPHVENMKQAVAGASAWATIEEASRAVAEMAHSCGQCHTTVAATITRAPVPEPQPGKGIAAHMRLHAAAADRMWKGLVSPSELSWGMGARTIGVKALGPGDLGLEGTAPEAIVELAKAVHTLGVKAAEAAAGEERVTAYAELLGTCGGCHKRLRSAAGAGGEVAEGGA